MRCLEDSWESTVGRVTDATVLAPGRSDDSRAARYPGRSGSLLSGVAKTFEDTNTAAERVETEQKSLSLEEIGERSSRKSRHRAPRRNVFG